MRNISDRMDKVEALHAARQSSMAQGPQQVIAAAQQKAHAHLAENYANRVDEAIENSHKKEPRKPTPKHKTFMAMPLAASRRPMMIDIGTCGLIHHLAQVRKNRQGIRWAIPNS